MSESTTTPRAADLLAVRSRVSWGAIAAGAMVALTIYIVLNLLGVALGIELAYRGGDDRLGAGAAIYAIVALLFAMFFGGWATSRLAVGESKLEAVLYGMILWGAMFMAMIWLVSAGVRSGFGAILGAASGTYTTDAGEVDVDRVAADLTRAGADPETVAKYRSYYERVKTDPVAAGDVSREASADPGVRTTASQATEGARVASWWSLGGVIVSLATVIIGALTGAGELLQPVPILGVRRPRDPRA